VPLTVSLKWYLDSPGRSIGHFAWVPARVTPFVGVGGGLMWYRLHWYGDFVDFADSSVVSDDFRSDYWTGTLHAFAGVDVAVGPSYIVTGRAQYAWAQSHLGNDFSGPNSVDLSGLSVTVGVGYRF
jgi:opacity protein-like surface antigen